MATLAAPVENLGRASRTRKWWSDEQSSRLILRRSDSLRIQELARCTSVGEVVVNGRGSLGCEISKEHRRSCIHPACRLSAICFNGDLGHQEDDVLLTSTRYFSPLSIADRTGRYNLPLGLKKWGTMQGVEDHS
jgi:hypothetical protein